MVLQNQGRIAAYVCFQGDDAVWVIDQDDPGG